jgi:hypothetical protein
MRNFTLTVVNSGLLKFAGDSSRQSSTLVCWSLQVSSLEEPYFYYYMTIVVSGKLKFAGDFVKNFSRNVSIFRSAGI